LAGRAEPLAALISSSHSSAGLIFYREVLFGSLLQQKIPHLLAEQKIAHEFQPGEGGLESGKFANANYPSTAC
jgi:hypothetical protein